ncbi:DUF6760 family protein [Ruminococcus sp. NK3A76]|uniref:DUF6760 family protein n=1 Tax=Ruminococcus sp. NK3A76 TaxID=877411 RepID=UPI00325AC856
MSSLRATYRDTSKFSGSRRIVTYPADKIYEEMAFIGYYMHWQNSEIARFSHKERQRWCKEISRINSKLNDEPENIFNI